jgi:hypothetical protein
MRRRRSTRWSKYVNYDHGQAKQGTGYLAGGIVALEYMEKKERKNERKDMRSMREKGTYYASEVM